jgi:hypothetical protein
MQHRTGAKAGAPGFGAVVYIDFPANSDIKIIKTTLNESKLQHKDGTGNMRDIRASNDVPLPVRHTSKVLGELWKTMISHVNNLPQDQKPNEFQLGNSNGKLFIVSGPRPVELFAATINEQGLLQIMPNDANLAKYGVTPVLSEAWAASAAKAASRFAGK